VVHLDAFRDLGQSGGYAWGVVALVHMYDQLDEASRTTTRQIAGYLTLFQVNFLFFNVTFDYDLNMFLCYVNLIFLVVLDL